MKLTHMYFTDDLVMCCKGEYMSMMLMLQAFQLFSDSSGLKANIDEFSIYACGMPQEDMQRVTTASGFTQKTLPFRYLGVPICAKRIIT